MSAVVKTPFHTTNRRFKVGDVVTREEVGDNFYERFCEPAQPKKAAAEKPSTDK